ncbi:MAG TPA: tetratricopeptide repeat protein [Candidatus Eisenbacteria bacterium]|nr:tetratricopeptide repeat protein [Candidatus Eisenbacteria bacterium]
MRRALLVLAVAVLAVGCASAVTQGQLALRQGRYVEAEGFFNEALAKDPGRTDALVGLGIAQYKGGLVDQAIESLEKAVPIRPNEPSVRLYLALAYLKREDTEKAEEQLTALRSLKIDSRVGDQVQQALDLLKQGPLTASVRKFIVGSLETQAELSRDVHDARLQAQMAQAYYYAYYPFAPFSPFYAYPYPYYGAPFGPYAPCVLVRRGGLPYCI